MTQVKCPGNRSAVSDIPARPIRTGQPVEFAWMAVFLASPESSLVNGAVIPVDSGASAF